MLWLAGFFMVRHGLASGVVDYPMNLDSLLNPKNAPYGGKWSYLLPGLPLNGLDYEGFNYLGLGIIFLGGFYLYHWRSSSFVWHVPKKWIPLVMVLFLTTIFALGNQVSLGHFKLFAYPALPFLEPLRSTGRMFWPLFYGGLFLLIRFLLKDHRPRTVAWVLAVALAAQVLDTSAGWLLLRHNRNSSYGSTWPTPLKSDFWEEASSRYQRVYLVPELAYPDSIFEVFAWYSLQHGLGTDAAYLARVDSLKLAAHCQRVDDEIASGNYDLHALYILDKSHAALAEKSLKPDRDLLENIDGFTVLAPGWKTTL
jgi:hypothetical protein